MNLSKMLFAFTLALGGVSASASPGFATSNSNAIASTPLNVRSGPSTQFNVLDTLYRGETVQTHTCQEGWCYITHSGPDGWVAARYLRTASTSPTYPRTTSPAPTPAYDPWPGPSIPWPFQVWPGNPRITIDHVPSQPTNQACFYTGNHYTGRDTCVMSGRTFEQLGPRWNNKISSIRVFSGATVTLCRNRFYGGHCRTIDNDVRALGQRLNDKVSSLRVD